MFAHLQVHMQVEDHYSFVHKGATYKEVNIYGIFQQRSNRSSDSRYRTGCRSRHLGSHQPAGGLRQRQPRCQVSGHEAADDDVIVCDPEAEYTALVKKFEGQVIKISPSSTQYINPMDINANYSEEDNPIALKADFILSLCELIVGGKEGLQPVEKTVIDRCVHQIYQTYFENPVPENMPVLQDLYEALLRQDEKEAHHVATALEIYVTGSLNLFNHRTNVDINNRLVCYDIKELGKQLKKIGMLVVQDQVWGRVTANRNAGKATRYYMDEFHLLLKEEQTAAYSVEIWKRFRKWGGIPTGITQNVKVRPDRALCKAV